VERFGTSRGEARFENGAARIAGACFGAVVAFIGLGGLASGEFGAAAILAGGLFFSYRALRSATVVLSSSDVELRGFARTRRLRLKDLAAAEVAIGQTGMNGFGREYLVLHRHDGAKAAFKELNAKPSPTESTVVHKAARAINDALREP